MSAVVSRIVPSAWFSSGTGVVLAAFLGGFLPLPRYSLYFIAKVLLDKAGPSSAMAFLFGTTISESLAATAFEIRFLGFWFWLRRISLTLMLVIVLSMLGGYVYELVGNIL